MNDDGKPTDADIDDELLFWVTLREEDSDEGTMGLFGGEHQLKRISTAALRESLARTVGALQKVFESAAERDGTLHLAEAQISFEVTASGGIQLIGTGNVAYHQALTLTFKRS